MIDWWLTPGLFALFVLAAFSVTWLIVFSTLMGSHLDSGTRWSKRVDHWAFAADGKDRGWIRGKIGTGYTCPICVSWWICLAGICGYVRAWPWQLDLPTWIVVAAVWAVVHWTVIAYHYITTKL